MNNNNNKKKELLSARLHPVQNVLNVKTVRSMFWSKHHVLKVKAIPENVIYAQAFTSSLTPRTTLKAFVPPHQAFFALSDWLGPHGWKRL